MAKAIQRWQSEDGRLWDTEEGADKRDREIAVAAVREQMAESFKEEVQRYETARNDDDVSSAGMTARCVESVDRLVGAWGPKATPPPGATYPAPVLL